MQLGAALGIRLDCPLHDRLEVPLLSLGDLAQQQADRHVELHDHLHELGLRLFLRHGLTSGLPIGICQGMGKQSMSVSRRATVGEAIEEAMREQYEEFAKAPRWPFIVDYSRLADAALHALHLHEVAERDCIFPLPEETQP